MFAVLVDQKLGRAGIAIVHRPGQPDGVVQNFLPRLLRQVLCRSQLHDLLMSSLNTAVALEQMHNLAVAITEQLHLDMLGSVEEALDKDGTVAEGRFGLGRGAFKGVLETVLVSDDPHAPATATKGCLDDDGKAMFVRELLDLFESTDGPVRPRNHWYPAFDGQLTSGNLVPERFNHIRGRTNELSGKWRQEDRGNRRCVCIRIWMGVGVDVGVREREKGENEHRTYDQTSFLNVPRKLGILREEAITLRSGEHWRFPQHVFWQGGPNLGVSC